MLKAEPPQSEADSKQAARIKDLLSACEQKQESLDFLKPEVARLTTALAAEAEKAEVYRLDYVRTEGERREAQQAVIREETRALQAEAKLAEQEQEIGRARELCAELGMVYADGTVETDSLKHALEDYERWRKDVPQLSIECDALRADRAALRISLNKREQEIERLRAEWSIMARACGNWRDFGVALSAEVIERRRLISDEEYKVVARAILERADLERQVQEARQEIADLKAAPTTGETR